MTPALESVLQAAMQLKDDERAALVSRLLENISSEDYDDELDAEMDADLDAEVDSD